MMFWNNFKWEPDNWWWEMLRLDELGLPASWNFLVPDKLMHFSSTFALSCLFSKLTKSRHIGTLIAYFLMMVPWELVWDGCFRYGASYKDMIANTLGALFAWYILGRKDVYGQRDPHQ
jgi:VanZ family protein